MTRLVRISLIVALAASSGCASRVPVPLPAPPPVEPPPPPAPASVVWQVEIYAGADPDRAEDVAAQARGRFDESVEILERGGEQHVRLGRFAEESSAQTLLRVVEEAGYRSARIVVADS